MGLKIGRDVIYNLKKSSMQANFFSQVIKKPLEEPDGKQETIQKHVPMEIDSQLECKTHPLISIVNEDNEKQMLRLIQQYLVDHGYQEVAQDLQTRSKVRMEEEVMKDFRQSVTAGELNRARKVVGGLHGLGFERQRAIEYQLYEQEYMELIESGRTLEAINVLQKEMMPRVSNESMAAHETGKLKLHQLAQLIIYKITDGKTGEIQRITNWKGSGHEGRKDLLDRLQALMPASEMLQPQRLEHILKQSLAFQVYNCKYHNVQLLQGGLTNYSLLEDHQCDRQQMIPSKCVAVLSRHKDEVWQVKFSQSGSRIAAFSKDSVIFIWSLTKANEKQQSQQYQKQGFINHKQNQQASKYRLKCTHEIRGHSKQVNSINWSTTTDDRWLVTASHDMTAKVWDSRSGKLAVEITKHTDAVMAAAFVPCQNNGDLRLLTSAVDKLVILWAIKPVAQSDTVINNSSNSAYTFEAVELARVETRNYMDLAVSSSRFVSMGQSHFQVFNLPASNDFKEAMEEAAELSYEVELSDTVTSIAVNRDGGLLLANVSLKQPRLELYDLTKRGELVRRYKGGHSQSIFILKCAFGGANESFVVNGSEDATVTIWNKDKGDIVAKIGPHGSTLGHSQTINSISWSPSDPYLFATSSDDQTVRIWGVESMSPIDVLQSSDQHQIKKTDLIRGITADPVTQNRIYSDEDEDDEDEGNNNDDEGQEEYDDEEDEEEFKEQMMEVVPQPVVVMQTTRVEAPGIREASEDEEEDEEGDWGEGNI